MLVTNISDFRKKTKDYINSVIDDLETIIINRGEDKGVVVMSLEEYNSFKATEFELKFPKNRKRLDSAIKKFDEGKGFEKELIDS